VELQKLRFGNDVEIISQIELKEQDQAHCIEPMLLIPFVENAFKHGVSIVERPHIDIRLSVTGEQLFFEVVNAFDPAFAGGKEESSGLGLKNVVSRLKLLYEGKHSLRIRKEQNLFHVTLNLQFV
jgi:two-component system LytT family sensor kinase